MNGNHLQLRKYIVGFNVLALTSFSIYAYIQNNPAPIQHTSGKNIPTGTSQPTPLVTAALSEYKDGNYTASGDTAWGTLQISATIKNDKIVSISQDQTPFSGPSEYAVPILIQEQLASQPLFVSGATTTTQIFSIEISQILSNARS